jgi:N-methylhydantoinase A
VPDAQTLPGGKAASASSGYRVAVDVGGTFIDYALLDQSSGDLLIEKQPATPDRVVDEFAAGLLRAGVDGAAFDALFHGTTLGINAIVQARGACVGLITTKGFRDVLELGRGGRPEIYNAFYAPPTPLVPRYLRREVPGRLSATGDELVPLDTDAVEREAAYLVDAKVDAIALCFLHSYANPAHERKAGALIRAKHPSVAVSTSSEITNEWREFERTSTAVLNAYIQPLMTTYLAQLNSKLASMGYRKPIAVMQSNGGVILAERSAQVPVRTLQSGPAGGVMGARALAAELGISNLICADVGGTTYDVALIEDGEILEKMQAEIDGRPVVVPTIDIVSIGAGGGSIGWVDDTGAVRVGPQSAGAFPGPACFGHGGAEPTVTDCHLVLGRLDAARFLGARMQLDVDAARRAILDRVAQPVGLSLHAAADGVLAIAETNMSYAIRAVTVERGRDPRDFVLLSYGGGGGLFAASVAEELEIENVAIPAAPANFAAIGILASDYVEDAATTRVFTLTESAASAALQLLRSLATEARASLSRYGFESAAIDVEQRVDARFAGQEHTLTVSVDGSALVSGDAFVSDVRREFVRAHQNLYGHGTPNAAIEVVTCRCRAIARVPRPRIRSSARTATGVPRTSRPVYFRQRGRELNTPILDRENLREGETVHGPAIVEEWTTTIVVPPGWSGVPDSHGNLMLSHHGNDT